LVSDLSTTQHVFKNDPALFCNIKDFGDELADHFKKLGPCQPSAEELPSKKFPADVNGRHFHSAYYCKTLPDGTKAKRDWITYSPSLDKAYCMDCMLFGKGTEKAWTVNGFNSWKKISEKVILHESSTAHVEASIKAKMKESCLPIIPSLEEGRKRTVLKNREIVKHLIDCVLYLAKHCVALRGHREFQKFDFHGNFVDLVALLGKYSPQLDMYLTSLLNREVKNSFLYWRRQNQLLSTIANHIKGVIVSEIKDAPFFSVSMDGTFDLSQKEQEVFVVRYVSGVTGQVVERLLSVKQCTDGTGKNLFELFKSICEEQGLDWKKYPVGQSHDGASNMGGGENGLQAFIRLENHSAIYVWCSAHRLALIVNDIAECCLEAKNLFSHFGAAFALVSTSKKRADFFEKEQKKFFPNARVRRVQRVKTTRWMSQDKALHVALDRYEAFISTLDYVSGDESAEREAKTQAAGLAKYFRSEAFFLTAFFFKSIFSKLEPLNAFFQKEDVDLISAAELIRSKQEELASLRSEASFEEVKSEYQKFVQDRSVENVIPLPVTRSRKRKTMSDETAPDEPQTDPFANFRINTFYFCLDKLLAKIKDRFQTSYLELIKDLSLFTVSRIAEIRNSPSSLPRDAFLAFSNIYDKFVKLPELVEEYKHFVQCYSELERTVELPKTLHPNLQAWISEDFFEPPTSSTMATSSITTPDGDPVDDDFMVDCLDEEEEDAMLAEDSSAHPVRHANSIRHVYEVFCSKGLSSIFPNVFVSLKIALTIPIASASCERKHSKLKLIKNRLRTSTLGERLDALMQIACEGDIKIDYEKIIDSFASLSATLPKQLIL